MVRAPCCEKMGLKRGPWTPEEDEVLVTYIQKFGHGNWRALPKQAGLLRCGKSCRLRWTNYLRPDIKRGNFTKEEEDAIIQLHEMLGNRWSAIAARLPGRTDNEIKNVWHTHLKKRLNQNKEVITTRKARASESKGKHRREEKRTGIAPEEVNPISPDASTSNFSFSSNESTSAATFCENTTSTSSLAAAEDESSLDSVHSNMLFQPCDSTTFWPENLPDIDEFWSETLKEEQFELDSGEFPADLNVHEPAFNVPLSPLPFSLYQDDSMDFWLNVLMDAGQMQMTQEI